MNLCRERVRLLGMWYTVGGRVVWRVAFFPRKYPSGACRDLLEHPYPRTISVAWFYNLCHNRERPGLIDSVERPQIGIHASGQGGPPQGPQELRLAAFLPL